MKKQDWIKDLQNKGDSYRQNLPEGLWEDISAQLDKKPVMTPARFNWMRWSSIAAAIVLAFGAGLVWVLSYENNPDASLAVADYRVDEDLNGSEVYEVLTVEGDEPVQILEPYMAKSQKAQLPENVDSEMRGEVSDHSGVTESIITEEKVPDNNEAEVYEVTVKDEPSQPQIRTAQPAEDYPLSKKSRKGRKWQFSLYGGGLAFASDLAGNEGMFDNLAPSESLTPDVPDIPGGGGDDSLVVIPGENPDDGDKDSDSDSDSDESRMSRGKAQGSESQQFGTAKHKMPLRFGAKVGIDLDYGFSLSTGLIYSYLASDFDKGAMHTDQNLHYLGLPLMLNYRAWTDGRFSFYAGIGGTVEKLVHGRATSHSFDSTGREVIAHYSLSERRLQWSANLSVGMSMKLYQNLCLFIEPGIGYYFDNHSSICNIYKEKPWNFDFSIGVKLNLNTK